MRQKYGLLMLAIAFAPGCEPTETIGGPGVEPPFWGPGIPRATSDRGAAWQPPTPPSTGAAGAGPASPGAPSAYPSANGDAANQGTGAEGTDPGTAGAGAAPPTAMQRDAGQPDEGQPDEGQLDAGEPEAGAPEAGEPDAGKPDTGQPDAGEPEPCQQSAERFADEFGHIAWEYSDCTSDEDCTVVRAKMTCPDRALFLATCAHAVNAARQPQVEQALTDLASIHYCTEATQDCTVTRQCVWPEEQALCINNACTPVYP